MAILTDRDRAAVQAELAKMAGPVKLIVVLHPARRLGNTARGDRSGWSARSRSARTR